MRSPLWFVVAGLIALAGFGGAVLYVMPRLETVDAQVMRVVVPGSAVLALDKPGTYTIYHEQRSFVDGQYHASDSVGGLRVGLTAEATGAVVKLTEPSGSSSYSIGNRKGTSILVFTIDQPGRYRLTASLANGRAEPKAVLAVEQGMMAVLFGLIFGTLAITFGGLGVAGAIVAVTIWQRSKAVSTRMQSIEPGGRGG
ncbi:MAG: hypothetical protein Q8L22_08345 [Reyranella sp.]|nr:hypothetical protein [Reyranella sp.]